MVSIFLVDTPMPVPAGVSMLRRIAARIFGATVGIRILARQPVAGESLKYIPESTLPDDLSWAAANTSIAKALAGCVQLIENEGEGALTEPVRSLVNRALSEWHGEPKGLSRQWVDAATDTLSDQERPAARLALLTALAPYQVDDTVIQGFRDTQSGDRELLGASVWSSMAAARRTCSWLVVSANPFDEVMHSDADSGHESVVSHLNRV